MFVFLVILVDHLKPHLILCSLPVHYFKSRVADHCLETRDDNWWFLGSKTWSKHGIVLQIQQSRSCVLRKTCRTSNWSAILMRWNVLIKAGTPNGGITDSVQTVTLSPGHLYTFVSTAESERPSLVHRFMQLFDPCYHPPECPVWCSW